LLSSSDFYVSSSSSSGSSSFGVSSTFLGAALIVVGLAIHKSPIYFFSSLGAC